MGEKFGIIGKINKAYQDLTITWKYLLGRISICNLSLNMLAEIKNIELLGRGQVNDLPTKMVLSPVKKLNERKILRKEGINVCFRRLKFASISVAVKSEKLLPNIIGVNYSTLSEKFFPVMKRIELKSRKSKVFSKLAVLEDLLIK